MRPVAFAGTLATQTSPAWIPSTAPRRAERLVRPMRSRSAPPAGSSGRRGARAAAGDRSEGRSWLLVHLQRGLERKELPPRETGRRERREQRGAQCGASRAADHRRALPALHHAVARPRARVRHDRPGGHRLARELRATDDAAPLALHGAALELLAVLSRTRARVRRRPPRWLDDVTDYLHEHKLERSHFTRTFVSYFGVPPGRWRSARA